MSNNHSVTAANGDDAFVPGSASVVVLVGGAFQHLANSAAAAGADVVVYIDVPNELEAVRPRNGVISVTLAAGQTLGTLVNQDCPGPFKEFVERHPAVNLSVGLGQLRAVGALAAAKLLEDPEFVRFLNEEIFERLFIKHNGSLDQVMITVCTSTAGGTGGPVGPAVARALAVVIFDRTEAVVHTQFLRAGSLSYVSLGDRVHHNGAATVAEDLRYIQACERHPREVRSLVLFELPMVGPRKDQRDGYVVAAAQALRARAVREHLDRCSPNDALSSPFGTVSLLRVSYWHGLADRRVAAEVAGKYLGQVKRALAAAPRAGLIDDVRVVLRQAPAQSPSLEEITDLVRQSRGVRPPDLFAICTRAKVRYTGGTVAARIGDRSVRDLAAEVRLFSAPCRTETEFVTKLTTMRALDAALEAELEARSTRAAELRRKTEGAQAALTKALRQHYPGGLFERLQATLAHPRAKVVVFKNALTRSREAANELATVEAEAEVLRVVRARLHAELEAEGRRLQGLAHVLAELAPAGPVQGLIEVTELDAVLERLLETAAQGPDSPELLRLLGSCVKRVTLAGLAEITRAPEPRLASVAATLVRGKPPTQAPVWGGKRPLGRGQVITVVPPLADRAEEELRALVRKSDGEMVLACADTAEGGVNALRLEVYKPKHWEEIVTPFIRKNLEEARREPALYFTNGHDSRHPAAAPPTPDAGVA
ncbi:MAG TPA: hypothetical protein VKA46_21300 [Gemmataceae bacterium]|nr:hypothetical protein [Gemmataceae bacterium]